MGGGFVDGEEDNSPLLGGKRGPWQILDGVLNHCGFGKTQIKLFTLCALVNFIEAMVTALVPLLFPLLKKEWKVDNAQLALLGSAISVGMLIGAVLLVFGFASAFAASMPVMAALQLMLGVGYGGNIVISTTYLCEFLPKNVRGIALTIVAFFFGVGGMVCVALGMYLIPLLGWRRMLMITITPIIPALILLITTPESPRYFLHSGQVKECVNCLIDISKYNKVALTEDLTPTVENMTMPVGKTKKVSHNTFSKQLSNPNILKTLIPLLLCWFFNAFGGNIFSWVPLYIAESTTLTGGGKDPMHNAYLAALFMSLGDALGTLYISIAFAFNFGRRVLLLSLLFAAAAGTVILGHLTTVNAIMFILPVLKSTSQATAVLYTYTPEVFPTSFRVNGLAMCSTVHRFAPVVAPYLAAALMKYSFIHLTTVFGGLYICGAISSLFLSVETAGRDVVEETSDKSGANGDTMLVVELCRYSAAGVPADTVGSRNFGKSEEDAFAGAASI